MVMKKLLLMCLVVSRVACIPLTGNQTQDLSPVNLNDGELPFSLVIEVEDYTLPQGIQSAAACQDNGQFLFIAGRSNGLHGFNNNNNNFPANQQNTTVFVIDPKLKRVWKRSLYDQFSGLTQKQIDSLSVTSPQFYQAGRTLYITGGYGVDTASGTFSTKDVLTAINIPGLIAWVINQNSPKKASSSIRQISNPVFQVTGGIMRQYGNGPTLLMFGQNFTGPYTPSSEGVYTQEIRRFRILDNGKYLGVVVKQSTQANSNYRRRDLNIIPSITFKGDKKIAGFIALSGVFTPDFGVWTVPVDIGVNGSASMADPALASTFKQSINNYYCARTELFSNSGSLYSILFGGITYQFLQNGEIASDPEFPFTNQIAVIKRNRDGLYQQYLLSTTYPTIASTASNPGNTLLFGAGAQFMELANVPVYPNGVINLAHMHKEQVIGYIIGGIQSTLPNTNTTSDSAASPYIFKVILYPKAQS